MTPRGWSFCYPRTQVRGFRRRRKLTPRGWYREGKQSNIAHKHSMCHPERSRTRAGLRRRRSLGERPLAVWISKRVSVAFVIVSYFLLRWTIAFLIYPARSEHFVFALPLVGFRLRLRSAQDDTAGVVVLLSTKANVRAASPRGRMGRRGRRPLQWY